MMGLATCATAAPPPEDLSISGVSYWAGDAPRCTNIGGHRSICSWNAPNSEYFVCVVHEGLVALNKDECVFEALANRHHDFITKKQSSLVGGVDDRAWHGYLDRAKAEVGIESNFFRVAKMVGHGPLHCSTVQTLFCTWETSNISPGHHDSLRYLATKQFKRALKNDRIRLMCEFDAETLKRTKRECIANFL